MRISTIGFAATAAAALLLGGWARKSNASRDRPDEFGVARTQPLVIPPDYSLAPPRAGDPQPQAADARTQALEALFGGPGPRSRSGPRLPESTGADRAALGARSVAGDPSTNVVDKGATPQTTLAAPSGAGRD